MASILYVGTSGTDDPTRAAAYLVKQEIASAVLPVGMPPLAEMIRKVVEHRVPVWV